MHLRARAFNFLVKIAKAIDRWFLGSLCQLKHANAKLQSILSQDEQANYKSDARLNLARDKMERGLEQSIERLKRVEEKARGTLIGVAIAVTIIGSATGILGSNGPFISHGCLVRVLAAMLLLAGIWFLMASGYLALKAYQTGKVYLPGLNEIEPVATKINHDCMLL